MTLLPLGVDVSKQKFDVALARDSGKFKHRVFPDPPAGFAQHSARLSTSAPSAPPSDELLVL